METSNLYSETPRVRMQYEDMIATVGHQLLKGRPLTDVQFDYFFDYYCNSGEMPYGVAKARTGDPYDWIDAKITEEYESQCHPVSGYVATNSPVNYEGK